MFFRQKIHATCHITSSSWWIQSCWASSPWDYFRVWGRWLGNLTPQNSCVILQDWFSLDSHGKVIGQNCKKKKYVFIIHYSKINTDDNIDWFSFNVSLHQICSLHSLNKPNISSVCGTTCLSVRGISIVFCIHILKYA